MLKRGVLKAGEALSLWRTLLDEGKVLNDEVSPVDRYVRRYCERYEGILCYKNTGERWILYKDVWIRFLTTGFPDLEIMQPVMNIPAGLRYLRVNGFSHNYKTREFRKDLHEHFPQWVIKSKGVERDRISRSHLNKFMAVWNGNR